MSACREYQGYLDRHGYGHRRKDAPRFGTALVHRQIWMMANGIIHPSQVVMHLCDNPACFRLDHLQLGTQADNLADMRAKGRARTNGFETKTHCPAGHPYDDTNTYTDKNGKRSCKTCGKLRMRTRRAMQRQT